MKLRFGKAKQFYREAFFEDRNIESSTNQFVVGLFSSVFQFLGNHLNLGQTSFITAHRPMRIIDILNPAEIKEFENSALFGVHQNCGASTFLFHENQFRNVY